MFEVLYQPLETFDLQIGQLTVNETLNETELTTTLINLEEFVNYSISVRAYTSVGAGPYSDEVEEMTDEAGMIEFLHINCKFY